MWVEGPVPARASSFSSASGVRGAASSSFRKTPMGAADADGAAPRPPRLQASGGGSVPQSTSTQGRPPQQSLSLYANANQKSTELPTTVPPPRREEPIVHTANGTSPRPGSNRARRETNSDEEFETSRLQMPARHTRRSSPTRRRRVPHDGNMATQLKSEDAPVRANGGEVAVFGGTGNPPPLDVVPIVDGTQASAPGSFSVPVPTARQGATHLHSSQTNTPVGPRLSTSRQLSLDTPHSANGGGTLVSSSASRPLEPLEVVAGDKGGDHEQLLLQQQQLADALQAMKGALLQYREELAAEKARRVAAEKRVAMLEERTRILVRTSPAASLRSATPSTSGPQPDPSPNASVGVPTTQQQQGSLSTTPLILVEERARILEKENRELRRRLLGGGSASTLRHEGLPPRAPTNGATFFDASI